VASLGYDLAGAMDCGEDVMEPGYLHLFVLQQPDIPAASRCSHPMDVKHMHYSYPPTFSDSRQDASVSLFCRWWDFWDVMRKSLSAGRVMEKTCKGQDGVAILMLSLSMSSRAAL